MLDLYSMTSSSLQNAWLRSSVPHGASLRPLRTFRTTVLYPSALPTASVRSTFHLVCPTHSSIESPSVLAPGEEKLRLDSKLPRTAGFFVHFPLPSFPFEPPFASFFPPFSISRWPAFSARLRSASAVRRAELVCGSTSVAVMNTINRYRPS